MPDIERTFTIEADPQTTWEYLTDMENFATHLPGFEEYTEIDETTSEWTVKIDLSMYSKEVTFEVEVVEEEFPEARFTLEPVDDPAEGAGSVHFESDGEGGTLVTFSLEANATSRMAPVLNKVIGRSLPMISDQFIENVQSSPELGTPNAEQ